MIGEPVTRLRRVADGVDRYGNPKYTQQAQEMPGAAVAEGDAAEPREVGRDAVVVDRTLFWFGLAVDGRADDRWVVRGKTYESVGPAFEWVNPWSSATVGTVVRLRAVTG